MNWIYRIDGGDGDQEIFGSPLLMEEVSPNWFTGSLIRGDAMLFQVHGDHLKGSFIAVTSRVTTPLSEQLERDQFASVVVHLITNPGPGFDGSEKHAFPFGMSVVERIAAGEPSIRLSRFPSS